MRLNISFRIIIGFMAMAALLVVINMVSIYHTNRIHTITEEIIHKNVSSFVATKELQLTLAEQQKGLTTNFLLTSDEQWLRRFNKGKTYFYNWFDKAQKTAETPQEYAVIGKIRNSYETYLNIQRRVVALYKSGRFSDAYDLRLNGMLPAFDATMAQLEAFWNVNEHLMKAAEAELTRSNTIVKRIMYAVMVGGALLGLFLGIMIARHITKPIYELVLKVRSATGKEDLVHNIEITNENELEQLGRGVRHLIDKVYQISEELAQSQQIIIRSEKLAVAGQLAAGIAHEIRNPLTIVKMLTFSLEKEFPPDNARRADIRRIIGEVERMEGVLHSFLDYARPQQPEFTRVSLSERVEQVLNLLQPEIKKRAIRVALDIRHDIIIHADQDQITQMLINLIMNAIDAMPKRGDLRIAIRPKAPASNATKPTVQIDISDTGVGIPKDLLPRVFEPFVTGKAKGTGLGLAIAYKIVETHGGWIQAKNNDGAGATFTVVLPVEP